jgi:hypothetical protein
MVQCSITAVQLASIRSRSAKRSLSLHFDDEILLETFQGISKGFFKDAFEKHDKKPLEARLRVLPLKAISDAL